MEQVACSHNKSGLFSKHETHGFSESFNRCFKNLTENCAIHSSRAKIEPS